MPVSIFFGQGSTTDGSCTVVRKFTLIDAPSPRGGSCRYILKDYFADLNWTPVLAATQPEEALEHWYSLVSHGMELFVPEKQVRTRPSNRPWYSSRLCRIRPQCDRLFNHSKKLPASHRLSLAYRQVRNWYVAELRSAERAFYREVSSQLSMRNYPGTRISGGLLPKNPVDKAQQLVSRH